MPNVCVTTDIVIFHSLFANDGCMFIVDNQQHPPFFKSASAAAGGRHMAKMHQSRFI